MAGMLAALAAMVKLEIAHVTMLSKVDLVGKETVERVTGMTPDTLQEDLQRETIPRWKQLNETLCSLLQDFNMVSLIPLR